MNRRFPILLLACAPFAVADDAKNKSVTVTETDNRKSVVFGAPTNTDGEKYTVTAKNGSVKYHMKTVSITPEDNNDKESWKCVESATSRMKWRIIVLRKTPLSVELGGTLIKYPTGSGGEGAKPDEKPFAVTVPAETIMTWNNINGSHANPEDKTRVRVAVGEPVQFQIKNSHLGNPSWAASGGKFQSPTGYGSSIDHEAIVKWYAPQNPGDYTVSATFPMKGVIGKGAGSGEFSSDGKIIKITFKVIIPTLEIASKTKPDKKDVFDGKPGSGKSITAMMNLKYTMHPRDVNYSHAQMAEGKKIDETKAYDLKGFWHTITSGNEYHHYVRHFPHENWLPYDNNGEVPDVAGVLLLGPNEKPTNIFKWESGGYEWHIPAYCRGKDPEFISLNRGESDGIIYHKTRIQRFDLKVTPSPSQVGLNSMTVEFTCKKDGQIVEQPFSQ